MKISLSFCHAFLFQTFTLRNLGIIFAVPGIPQPPQPGQPPQPPQPPQPGQPGQPGQPPQPGQADSYGQPGQPGQPGNVPNPQPWKVDGLGNFDGTQHAPDLNRVVFTTDAGEYIYGASLGPSENSKYCPWNAKNWLSWGSYKNDCFYQEWFENLCLAPIEYQNRPN